MKINQIVSNTLSSNVYVLTEKNSSIIIDAGCTVNMVSKIVNNTKVEAIFLTHLHFDHVFYLKDYVENFNCPVYLFNSSNVNNNNFTLKNMVGNFSMPQNCYKNLNNINKIKLNNFVINCYHTPGHSFDSMCYLIENNLFSGDTLFSNSIGRTDLPTSNITDMKNSLEFLKTLKFNNCYSGHGESSSWQEQQENINYFLLEI